jgi:hypothetical protein
VTDQTASNVIPLPLPGDDWPLPPRAAAFTGLAGEIVRAIEPHSESDPLAILVQLLSASARRSAAARTTRSRRPSITATNSPCSWARARRPGRDRRGITCSGSSPRSTRTGPRSGSSPASRAATIYRTRLSAVVLVSPAQGGVHGRLTSDNQSWSRNAITASLGWYRPGAVPAGVMRSIASCLIALSACR